MKPPEERKNEKEGSKKKEGELGGKMRRQMLGSVEEGGSIGIGKGTGAGVKIRHPSLEVWGKGYMTEKGKRGCRRNVTVACES